MNTKAKETAQMGGKAAGGKTASNGNDKAVDSKQSVSDGVDSTTISAILGNPDFVSGVDQIVTGRFNMLLSDTNESTLKTSVSHLVDQHLDDNLADRVTAAMPETPEQTAKRRAEEAEQDRKKQISANHRSEKRRAEAEKVAAEERQNLRRKAKAAAQEMHDGLASERHAHKGPVSLEAVETAALQIDDGTTFSIDFGQRAVKASDLSIRDDGAVTLKHPAISIGTDMPERFTARGVTLFLRGADEMPKSLRCVLPNAVTVGDGMIAQLGANSLIFRAG